MLLLFLPRTVEYWYAMRMPITLVYYKIQIFERVTRHTVHTALLRATCSYFIRDLIFTESFICGN